MKKSKYQRILLPHGRLSQNEYVLSFDKVPVVGHSVPVKKKTGFALMTKERLKEVSAQAGRSAWKKGKPHKFTSEEARDAVNKRYGKNPKSPSMRISVAK